MRKPHRTIFPAIGVAALLLVTRLLTASGTDSTLPAIVTATLQARPVVALLVTTTETPVPPTVSVTPTSSPPATRVPPQRVTASPTLRAKASPTAAVNAAANQPGMLNGVPLDRILIMTDAARRNIRDIFAKGQSLGRNPRAFSKVGDSTMVYPPLLSAFGGKDYALGKFSYLQATIDYFGSSLARTSAAAKKGMHTWTEFDPAWVALSACGPQEGPLGCELRLNNPSIAIIRLGANDYYAPKLFNEQLRRIIDTSLAAGVIPILGTKPDRMEGPANTLNGMIAEAANAYAIPLWDYDAVAATVPGKGLVSDGVHIRGIGSHDFTSTQAFSSGDSLEDLTALMMLDAVRRELVQHQTSSSGMK